MQDQINYLIHKIYSPPYYHREYEQDLPQKEKPTTKSDQAKRALQLVLPFLSLYRPLGYAISTSMGGARVLSNSVGVYSAETMSDQAKEIMQLGLASLALTGTLYHFSLGLYLTTAVDLSTNLARLLESLYHHQYNKAGDEILQTLTSGLYLAIMMTGSLEVVLTSLLMQALVSFYQAREEWSKGKMPEAMAKSLMGMIRLYQGSTQLAFIQRRDTLVARYREVASRIQKSREVEHLRSSPIRTKETQLPNEHPLENISEKLDQHRVVLKDGEGNSYDLGAHFHGFGKQKVKGMNITFTQQAEKTVLTFKINHIFRDRLQTVLHSIENAPPEEINDLLRSLGSHIEELKLISRDKEPLNWWDDDSISTYELKLKGLGRIEVGADQSVITNYDKVTVTMDRGKSIYEFHEALSFLDLDDALKVSAQEDVDRMKMGHLYRTFYPRDATLFERTDPFFDLPIAEFKAKIIECSPEMKEIIDQWLPKMEEREILPGRYRYAFEGLAEELKSQGARGLTAAITGAWTTQELQERIASILKMGLLSHEMRENYSIDSTGLSGGTDYMTGGADSVFTQLVTNTNTSFNEFAYNWFGGAQLLFSPKILEMGTYQHHSDAFGNRIVTRNDQGWFWFDDYLKRNNIFDFMTVEKLYFHSDHEVMIKDRIPPEFIKGIVVQDQAAKDNLLFYLRSKEIVEKDSSGSETILSKPIDQFLWVGHTIYDEMFA